MSKASRKYILLLHAVAKQTVEIWCWDYHLYHMFDACDGEFCW